MLFLITDLIYERRREKGGTRGGIQPIYTLGKPAHPPVPVFVVWRIHKMSHENRENFEEDDLELLQEGSMRDFYY